MYVYLSKWIVTPDKRFCETSKVCLNVEKICILRVYSIGNQIKCKIRNDNNMSGYGCILKWMDEPEDFNTGETTL